MANQKRGHFRWLRFSIRSVLIVTLVAAIVCAWWLQPEKREVPFVGGAMVLQQSYKHTSDDNSATVNHGSWLLKDRDGTTRVSGRFLNGQPHGKWTTYHPNAQKATDGRTRSGRPTGRWRSWHPDGTLQSEFHYGEHRLSRQPPKQVFLGTPMGGIGYALDSGQTSRQYASPREGPVQVWWPNGQPRIEGQYANDLRDGRWTFYDQQGVETANGTYSNGRRHGFWTTRLPDGMTVQEVFAAGKPISDLPALINSCIAEMNGDDLLPRLAAARKLRALNSLAVPALTEQLASSNRDVQLLALRTLGQIGSPANDALPAIDGFASSHDRQLRIHMLLARHSIDAANRTANYRALVDVLNENDGRLYVFAMCRVFESDAENRQDVYARLMTTAAADKNDTICQDIIRQIASFGGTMKWLEQSIQDENVGIRLVTIDVLEEKALAGASLPRNGEEGPSIHELLEIARNDTNEMVRQRAERIAPWIRSGPMMGGGSFF